MGHNDLGELLYERGDLQGAFKCWVSGRDYSAPSLPAPSPSPGICLPPLPRIITLLPKP